ncbi:MAG: hypothetical protein M1833_007305 [Piccolia ochrophora]|nr:MAG: hypothetical protein M1833_007305 [Piccolia ochrophora]
MEFAAGYLNLAMVRSSQREHQFASRLLQEAVKLAKKANGPHTACIQNFKFDWVTVLLTSGELEAAKKKYKSILANRKRIFGTSSLRTRHSYYALGVTNRKLRKAEKAEYQEAKELEQSARDIRDRVLHEHFTASQLEKCDEIGIHDYMVSCKAGRTTMRQVPDRPLEIASTGIDHSIYNFGPYDSILHNPATDDESS